jgi:hypothetical protein
MSSPSASFPLYLESQAECRIGIGIGLKKNTLSGLVLVCTSLLELSDQLYSLHTGKAEDNLRSGSLRSL